MFSVPRAGVSGRAAQAPESRRPRCATGLVFTDLAGISFSLGEEPLFSPSLEGTLCGTAAKLFLDLESGSVSHAVVSEYL